MKCRGLQWEEKENEKESDQYFAGGSVDDRYDGYTGKVRIYWKSVRTGGGCGGT